MRHTNTPRGGLRAYARLCIGVAAVALAALAIDSSFHVADPTVRGTPHWSEAVDSAAATCRRRGDETAPVNISPPDYALFVSCERLSDAGR